MSDVVVFAVGSPLVVDYVESLRRNGHRIRAGVRNFDGAVYLSQDEPIVDVGALTDELRTLPYIVPLFTPGNRQFAVQSARSLGFQLPLTLVDTPAAMPQHIQLGQGTYINAGCSIGAASTFGEFVLINRGASIGHHADFARFVSIGPGAVIAGQVTIGRGSVVGAGAVILPGIRIGSNAVIAAGAVVIADVEDQTLVVGNPAGIRKRSIIGYKGIAVE
jgi:sugar O-acyltransferase (sialic acid O-acetyltransferase NeuD family)